MRKLLLILLGFPMIGLGQQFHHEVKRLRTIQDDDKIIIKYDIIASAADQYYTVKINVFKNGDETPLKKLNSFTGDIDRYISAGVGKIIKWDVLKDLPAFNEDDELVFEVIAELQKLSFLDSKAPWAFLSIVAPGFADYKVFEKKKPYWLKTVVFYSGIVGGVWMNKISSSNYKKYNEATELDAIESYYSKANNMNKWSNYCFIISGTIMVQDVTKVFLRGRKKKKQYNLNK